MRRSVLIALCALAALVGMVSEAAASSPRAKLQACATSLSQPSRYAVFVGKMKSLRRGNKMSLRFDLYQRTKGTKKFTRVDAPDLGVWHRANAGVPSYTFRQRVQGLSAPAAYRARISFRWKGPKGKRAVTIKKSTPACVQPDLRPDLRVSFVKTGASAGQVNYQVVVRNAGKTAAGAFQVDLAPASGPEMVTGLGPGAEIPFQLSCTANSTIQATVDPLGTVDERNESNNTATRVCLARRGG
jgi:hypothetical protein